MMCVFISFFLFSSKSGGENLNLQLDKDGLQKVSAVFGRNLKSIGPCLTEMSIKAFSLSENRRFNHITRRLVEIAI